MVDMDDDLAELGVQVWVGPDGDAEQVTEATLGLRREFLGLDVDSVEVPRTGEPPADSRAAELADEWLERHTAR